MVSEALRGNKTIYFLNIAKNDITCYGMEKFAPVLHTTAIMELDLSLNPLGNNGVKVLADNLWEPPIPGRSRLKMNRKSCNLEKLNLS